ncbi:MAG: bacillithiol biosynthesis cysteine-adding enzyme BshC [Bacteroidetes bacterium]|nr:bacillithiol biosynthesis cysteine-adding enzyme BshC [Bacteroidota bacterium]MCB9044052.1 bacillithiol biosynthesis cysteine-adding enzyme BshC [Chitinophagales bacterium]
MVKTAQTSPISIEKHYYSYAKIDFFSALVKNYHQKSTVVEPFYNLLPDPNNVPSMAAEIDATYSQNRDQLADILVDLYQNLPPESAVQQNIDRLRHKNTYTITTGHQCNLFTGPLYMMYKILHVIKLSDTYHANFPHLQFVPVFWLNSEDHDMEELNHFYLFGQKIEGPATWNGAMGKQNAQDLSPIIALIDEKLGTNQHAEEVKSILHTAYEQAATHAEAQIRFLHSLFGRFGLVIIDQSHSALKKMARPLLHHELTHVGETARWVELQNEALTKQNYHAQAKAQAVNLFWLEGKERLKIEVENDKWTIATKEKQFSLTEMQHLAASQPENFSFNVISRPLYQQWVLPNMVYVGGGGEIAYWLQLKQLFGAYKIFFPALQLRQSVLWVDKYAFQKMEKLNFSLNDLWTDEAHLVKNYVQEHTHNELNLTEEKKLLQDITEQLKQKAVQIDASLEASVLSENARILNAFDNLEAKLIRAEKRKYEQQIQQIQNLKQKLFPNNGLQERHDNIIEYLYLYGISFIDCLYDALLPFNEHFLFLCEE